MNLSTVYCNNDAQYVLFYFIFLQWYNNIILFINFFHDQKHYSIPLLVANISFLIYFILLQWYNNILLFINFFHDQKHYSIPLLVANISFILFYFTFTFFMTKTMTVSHLQSVCNV